MARLIVDHFKGQEPNFSGFVVIGAGLPRTGTSSLRLALSHLLHGACYHMSNVFQGNEVDFNHWEKTLQVTNNNDSSLSKEEWTKFLQGRGFVAATDYPASLFYKDLMEIFPNAKVILTVRDNPEAWYQSVRDSVYSILKLNRNFSTMCLQTLLGSRRTLLLVERICKRPPTGFTMGMLDAIECGSKESEKFYNEWVNEVQNSVPNSRLLVFNVKEGWEPLCKFLDVPVPEIPFPHENEKKIFQKNISKIKILSTFVTMALPIVSAFLIYSLIKWFPDTAY